MVGELQYKSRRDMLQEYVKNVQPEYMERFVQKAPTQVGLGGFGFFLVLVVSLGF